MGRTIRYAALAGAGAAAAWGAAALWRRSEANAIRAKLPAGAPSIAVLGSGFGGMSAASELARLLPDEGSAAIRLIDQRGQLLFTPMLTEVAAGEVDARHVLARPGQISPRVSFVQAEVESLDVHERRISLRAGGGNSAIPEWRDTITADHIVIALGSVTNYHDVPGLQEHSLSIRTVQEAITIRNRALDLLERASMEQDAEKRRALLTFVIGGGGYTGVETAAALNGLVREAARKLGRIAEREIRILLVEPGERLMPETTPELARYAHDKLEQGGVTVMLGVRVSSVSADTVELDGRPAVPAHTLIWAGGVKPNPLVETLDCRKGKHGGVLVDENCAVPGCPGIWAIGDCAEIPSGKGHSYAPTAQNATREGSHVARNIVRVLTGDQALPFRYQPAGELALTGRRSGVARIYGVELSGFPAWMLWRSVYLLKMPEMSQRFRIGLDWLLDLAFGRNLVEVPEGTAGR